MSTSEKKPKKEHFTNLYANSISDNSKFLKIFKPLSSNAFKAKTTIKLRENNKWLITTMKFQNHLTNILWKFSKSWDYLRKKKSAISKEDNLGEMEIATPKYENHPSITAITEKNGKTW